MRGLGVVIGQLISGPWSLLKRKRKLRWLLKVIFLYTLTHSSNEEWSHCWSLDHYGKDLSYLRHYLKLHHLSFDEKQLLELLQIVVDAVEVIALVFLNLLFQYHPSLSLMTRSFFNIWTTLTTICHELRSHGLRNLKIWYQIWYR